MSILDRIFGGVQSVIQLRTDVDQATKRLDRHSGELLDHEKRLIRIETMIEMGGGRPPPRRLPRA